MKLIPVINKEVIQSFRDYKTLFLMIFMPTALTILLSVVFNNDLNNKIDLSKIHVDILNSKGDTTYMDGIANILKQNSITVTYLNDLNNFKANSSILIKNNENNDITIYYSKNREIYGKAVTTIVKNFIQDASIIECINNIQDSSYETSEIKNNNLHININTLTNKRPASSLDYYGVSMVILTVMFSSVTGAYKIISDRESGNLQKLLTLPINIDIVLFGKLIGGLIISILQIIVVLLISTMLLNVNWGNNLYIITYLLLTLSSLSISLGIFSGIYIKDNKSCWTILLAILMFFGLIGGAFIPLDLMNNSFINEISVISPIRLSIASAFNAIYLKDYLMLKISSIIFVTLTFLIIKASSISLEARK